MNARLDGEPEPLDGMLSIEQRKKLLIAQGAIHRFALLDAKAAVKQGVRGKAMLSSAAGAAALAGIGLLKRRGSAAAGGAQTLLPLAVSGISLLIKHARLRPGLRKTLLAGAAALAAAYLVKAVRRRGANVDE